MSGVRRLNAKAQKTAPATIDIPDEMLQAIGVALGDSIEVVDGVLY